jgi:hypothetical protein
MRHVTAATILAIAIVSSASVRGLANGSGGSVGTPQPLVSPSPAMHHSPAPIRNHFMTEGALYFTSAHPTYFNFPRPLNAPSQKIAGYIRNYAVATEKTVGLPTATILFIPGNFPQGEVVVLSYPLKINGKSYTCARNAASEFERRFSVCQSLPAEVVGLNHPVSIDVYRMIYPQGSSTVWKVTDTITSISH